VIEQVAEYGLCFAAAAIVCISEGLVLTALFFAGLAFRAVWSKLLIGAENK
jgi:hypothetical protein